METSAFKSDSRSKLVNDLQAVIHDAEELLKNVGDQTDSKFQSAKDKFNSTMETARSNLSSAQESLLSRTKTAAASTDKYVQDNPWRSVGVVAAVGLVIGLLLGRK